MSLIFEPNKIYYSLSWATDGVNWSTPQLLLSTAWLPAATAKDGIIYLYANDNGTTPFGSSALRRYNLGTSGVSVVAIEDVKVGGIPPTDYFNVDVMYRPNLGYYQILAGNAAATKIDYLTSSDGMNWSLVFSNIIQPGSGETVKTPAPHPSTHCWVYFGKDTPSGDHDIYFSNWCQ